MLHLPHHHHHPSGVTKCHTHCDTKINILSLYLDNVYDPTSVRLSLLWNQPHIDHPFPLTSMITKTETVAAAVQLPSIDIQMLRMLTMRLCARTRGMRTPLVPRAALRNHRTSFPAVSSSSIHVLSFPNLILPQHRMGMGAITVKAMASMGHQDSEVIHAALVNRKLEAAITAITMTAPAICMFLSQQPHIPHPLTSIAIYALADK